MAPWPPLDPPLYVPHRLLVVVLRSDTRKLSYRKDDRAMRPLYGCSENVRRVPDYTHGYCSRNFKCASVPIEPMNVRIKFEVRSLLVPES